MGEISRQCLAMNRCSDGDQLQWITELGPACCGDDLQYCPGYHAQVQAGYLTSVPTQGGKPICIPGCAETAEEMYAECHPRWEADPEAPMENIQHFLAACQGMPIVSGGRRELGAERVGSPVSGGTAVEDPDPVMTLIGTTKYGPVILV